MRKLRLVLNITYDDNGVPEEDLRRLLGNVVIHAMNVGLITGDTEAEVESHEYRVESVTLDDPIPTVLYLNDGEDETYLGVALRPRKMTARRFEAKIATLWRTFLGTPQPPKLPPFNKWLEREHGIHFLKSDFITVAIDGNEEA